MCHRCLQQWGKVCSGSAVQPYGRSASPARLQPNKETPLWFLQGPFMVRGFDHNSLLSVCNSDLLMQHFSSYIRARRTAFRMSSCELTKHNLGKSHDASIQLITNDRSSGKHTQLCKRSTGLEKIMSVRTPRLGQPDRVVALECSNEPNPDLNPTESRLSDRVWQLSPTGWHLEVLPVREEAHDCHDPHIAKLVWPTQYAYTWATYRREWRPFSLKGKEKHYDRWVFVLGNSNFILTILWNTELKCFPVWIKDTHWW